jgi:hypothetical protein
MWAGEDIFFTDCYKCFLDFACRIEGSGVRIRAGKRFFTDCDVFLILPVAEDGPGFAHGQGKKFSSSKRLQTGYGTHPASHSMTAGVLS